jgi:hypothetical protein
MSALAGLLSDAAIRQWGDGLAGDRRKIAAMREELQPLDEPTRRFTPRVRERG